MAVPQVTSKRLMSGLSNRHFLLYPDENTPAYWAFGGRGYYILYRPSTWELASHGSLSLAQRGTKRPVRRLDSAKQVRKRQLDLRVGNRPHHAGFPGRHGQRVEPPSVAMGIQRRNKRRAAFVPCQGKRQLECCPNFRGSNVYSNLPTL